MTLHHFIIRHKEWQLRLYLQKARSLACMLVVLSFCFFSPPAGAATSSTPDYVRKECPVPLTRVGHGIYRRFGFRVYEATLWAATDRWQSDKPFLLELRYTRAISKDTLVDTVIDDIRDQGTADGETLARWQKTLEGFFPEVKEGDVLAGLSVPGQQARLFLNGRVIAVIDDADLSKAFFDMWFGDHADEDLRASLLAKSAS